MIAFAGHEHGFRRKAVQAKDVTNLQALDAVCECAAARKGGYALLADLEDMLRLPTVKIVLAKLRKLIHQGFVDGCACGCSGSFILTPAGRAELSRLREVEASRKVMADA